MFVNVCAAIDIARYIAIAIVVVIAFYVCICGHVKFDTHCALSVLASLTSNYKHTPAHWQL